MILSKNMTDIKRLKFKRTLVRQGGTHYVNIPPILLEYLQAENVQQVIVSDLDDDRIQIELVREGCNAGEN